MTITSIVLLIFLGLFLLILEILFVPGMVLGFISIILMLIGIIFSFKDYGSSVGLIVLGGTVIAAAFALYGSFNSPIWKKMQVQSQIDGKANTIGNGTIKKGDAGKTISRLNPMGKALINGLQVEVQVNEGFIDPEKDITVVKVQQNKIFVTLS